MANLNDLAAELFGTKRLESGVNTGGTNNSSGISGGSRTSNGGSSLSSTVGLATSNSQDGKVTVRISDYTTTSDIIFDESMLGPEIEIGTTVNVKAGQYVHITLINHDTGSQPIVMGVIGGGDEMNSRIEQAEEDLEKAETSLYGPEGHPEEGLVKRVETAETTVGTIEDILDGPEGHPEEGLVQRVETAETTVGDIEDALDGPDGHPEEGLKYKVTVEIPKYVNDAQESAYKANEYATTALAGLGSVQNVADTLMWIAQNGRMTPTTDVEPDPTKLYFIEDENGKYPVGGSRYTIVTEPDPEHMADYFTMSMDNSVQNYLLTHLAVTDDGLYVFGDKSRIVVGTNDSFHVVIDATQERGEIAFCQGMTTDEHGNPIHNRIAWITNNELHIPRAIVTEGVQVGNYRWVELANGNFALRYLG